MRTRSRHLLRAVVVTASTLGATLAINTPLAGAQPQDCAEPSPGVHQCTSPGHAQIHVPAPPASGPNNHHGPGGGPPLLTWIGS